MKMFRTPEISTSREEHENPRVGELGSPLDMSRVEYVGSSIGNYLLRKTLKEGGIIEFVDNGLRITKKDEAIDS